MQALSNQSNDCLLWRQWVYILFRIFKLLLKLFSWAGMVKMNKQIHWQKAAIVRLSFCSICAYVCTHECQLSEPVGSLPGAGRLIHLWCCLSSFLLAQRRTSKLGDTLICYGICLLLACQQALARIVQCLICCGIHHNVTRLQRSLRRHSAHVYLYSI